MTAVTPVDPIAALSPALRARLTLEVLRTYLRVRVTMRDDDATRAVTRLRERSRPVEVALAPAEEFVAALRLARIVRRVLTVLPSDSRCLFRSLTLICLLERRRISQTLVIAVRSQPFAAHAWVELDGRPVLPTGEPGYERLVEL
jgi:Transglutaminase-like superfamily